jgi:hypothetical protein
MTSVPSHPQRSNGNEFVTTRSNSLGLGDGRKIAFCYSTVGTFVGTPARDGARNSWEQNMGIYRRDDSRVFWVEFEFRGTRYRQSSGTTRKTDAEVFERQLRQELYECAVLGRARHEPMRFEDAVSRYTSTHLRAKARLDKTAESDAYMLARVTELNDAFWPHDAAPAVVLDVEYFADARHQSRHGTDEAGVMLTPR